MITENNTLSDREIRRIAAQLYQLERDPQFLLEQEERSRVAADIAWEKKFERHRETNGEVETQRTTSSSARREMHFVLHDLYILGYGIHDKFSFHLFVLFW